MPRSASRVLAIHPGALGDLVIALPAFTALRHDLRPSRYALLVGRDLAEVADGFDLFDDLLTIDTRAAYHGNARARVASFGRAASAARAWRPTEVFVFKAAPAWAALGWASGARTRAGLTRGVGAWFLTRPVRLDPGRHHAERNAAVVGPVGGADAVSALAIPPGWRAVAAPGALTLAAGRPLIGFAPGGARNAKHDTATKRWSAARFATVASALLDRHPTARLVLIGGPGDRVEAEVVLKAVDRSRTIDLVGGTSVAEARAAIAALDLLVVNDSALLHVAGTTATPTVAIFGPTDPRVLAPNRPNVHALWSPAGRTPCWDERDGRQARCADVCCIDRVSVASVLATAEDALAASPRNPAPDREP